MDNNLNKRAFRPVYGTESKILKADIHEGYVYVASDSGKIFLDAADPDDIEQIVKRKQIGGSGSGGGSGSTGLYWANGDEEQGTIVKATEDADDGDPVYYFSINAIEGNALPDKDALILNADGRFFRVTDNVLSSDGLFTVELIAVSGGGSGGGGGGPVGGGLTMTWENIDQLGSTYIYGQDSVISVVPHSENDDIVSVKVIAKDAQGNVVAERQGRVLSDQAFNDFNAKFLPAREDISIEITVADTVYNKGKGLTRTFSPIKVLKMYVEKPTSSGIMTIQQGQAQLPVIPYFAGLGTTENPVRIFYSIDDGPATLGMTLISDNHQKQQRINIPAQEHGMHTVKLWSAVSINNVEYNSDVITYEVPWVDISNPTPIIWVESELGTVVNYEEAVVKYMVYSAEAERQGAPVEVSLYRGTDLLNTEEVYYDSISWHTMDLTSNYTVGNNVFTLTCGFTTKEIKFYVTTENARDLSLRYEDQLEINFDATGRSSKEIKSSRSTWISKATPKKRKTNIGVPYSANLSGFNWYSNGWKNDGDGNGSYLSFANGASATIPMDTISMNQSDSWTFEMRFRVRNAKRFATLVTNIPQYRYYLPAGGLAPLGEEKTIEEIAELWGIEVNQVYDPTILLYDEDGNPVMNEANTVKKIVRTNSDIAFKYLSGNIGFAIGTQEAYFNTSGGTVNVRYAEDEIINIAFVFDKPQNQLSIYLNGILSGSLGLGKVNSITMENIPFIITSTDCDFDLYRFRVYPLALTMPDIIHNYIADMKNISIYDENDLTDVNDDTKLSYTKLLDYNSRHPENPTMPYAVIDLSDKTGREAWLPWAKGNPRSAKITFVNPTADYLLATGQITPYQYYTHCPSFVAENVDTDVQGTSSQKYPRRNFKTKFKSAKKTWVYTQGELKDMPIADGAVLSTGEKISKKWHMDSEKLGVNKFTWKIDYMESSGSYNTGLANFMGTGVYSKHPLEDLHLSSIDASIYRTTVYGFPMLVFYKGEDQEYVYIGRYNLNLDKGANERYGFEEKVEQPYVDAPWDETADDGTITHHEHPYIANVAECWELRDNQGTYCSWRYPNATARAAGFDARVETDPDRIAVSSHFEARYHADADPIEWAQTIIAGESSNDDYSEKIGGNTPAIASNYVRRKMSNLERLFNWLDSTDTSNANASRQLESPVVIKGVSRQLSTDEANVQGVTYEKRVEDGKDVIYGTFTTDSVEYRLQKFYSEFDKHLDREYCAVYFVITELLLCYDSRGKNMMMATFGPREAGGEYIWYPIFYDADTQLGLNNVGAKLWDYDEDCTENGTFSTKSSVIWTNMYEVFRDYIISIYGTLRKTKITYDNIENSYLCQAGSTFNSYAMMGKRPIIAIGLDAYYKYVLPTKEDWINQSGEPARADYLYACQGDRILSREMLINNRLLYMDSKFGAGNFTYETGALSGMNFRVSGNKPSTTSDKYLDAESLGLPIGSSYTNPTSGEVFVAQKYPYKYFDAIPEYYVTPYLNFYPTVFIDKMKFRPTESYNPDKYPNGMPVKLSDSITGGYYNGDIDQQLNYIAGTQYVSSLGDLSTKYATEIHFPNTYRLRDITLGSDIPGYYNNEKPNPLDLSASVDPDGSIPNSNKKPLLEKIVLTSMTGISDGIDVRAATRLKEFRALNTQLPSVLFASGAPLTTVHLPRTTTELIFNENKDLTKILRTAPTVLDYNTETNEITSYRDPASYAGLYVAGLTDVVDDASNLSSGSALQEISFSGDAMNYDSYEILRNVVHQKYNTGRTEGRLKIRMTDVNWSPYVQVEYGEEKKSGETYYYLTDHSTYEVYNHNDSEWLADTLNGRVYTYDNTKDESIITDLSLLQIFIDDMNAAKQISQETHTTVINQFTNNIVSMSAEPTYPTLSGEMFISNASGTAVDEAELTSVYAEIWPNLKIRAAKVNKAYISKFVQRLDSGKDTELDIHRAARGENVHPTMSAKQPTRANYVFRGWTLDVSKAIVQESDLANLIANHQIFTTQEEFNYLTFSNENDAYTFYAVFTITNYNYNFRRPNGDLIKSYQVSYGSYMSAPLLWPSYDDSSLDADQTYRFIGWTKDQSNCIVTNIKLASLVDFSKEIAQTNDKDFYASFVPAGIKENKIPEELCRINGSIINPDGASGYAIDMSSWELIEGKITLPTVAADGHAFVSIAARSFGEDWEHRANIVRHPTHVFFDGAPQIVRIGNSAFGYNTSLEYFEFPDTVKSIYNEAFVNCTSLQPFELCEGLTYLAAGAFQSSFNRESVMDRLYIPSTLTDLPQFCLQVNCKKITTIEVGNSTNGNSLAGDLSTTTWFGVQRSAPMGNNRIDSITVYGGDSANFAASCYYQGYDKTVQIM